MKSLNTYIFEVNNDIELFNIVNEVLNNEEYTSEQIEESFNYANLILEKLSSDEIKTKLKKYIKANDEMYKKLAEINKEEQNKLNDIDDQYKDWYKVDDYNKRQKVYNRWNSLRSNIYDEYRKKRDECWKEYDMYDEDPDLYNVVSKLISYKQYIQSFFTDDKHKECFKLFTDPKRGGKLSKEVAFKSLYVDPIYKGYTSLGLNKIDFNKFDKDDMMSFIKELKLPFSFDNNEINLNSDAINKMVKNAIDYDASEEIENISQGNESEIKVTKDEIKDIDTSKEDNSKEKDEDTDKSSESSQETQSEEEQKEQTTEVISDNKDLLTPVAKAANVTGEQLLNIITKLCVDKKGKARKLEDGVIVGLSIMICGMLLSVKKTGKSDNSAIKAIVDKMKSIIDNKKAIKSIINK